MTLRITCILLAGCQLTFSQTPEQIEFFEKKIRPVLAQSCQACHNPKVKTAQLDFSSAEGFAAGGQSGALVSREQPEESRLLKVISYEDRLKMPPTGKLKPEEIADLTAWVKMGAPWPGAAPAVAAKKAGPREYTETEKNYWAFQPLANATPPPVNNQTWARSPVDRFILARLESKSLKPAAPADKATLLRRVTFDLTGLPPTEAEIRDFLADDSADAFPKVVDRLLASPRYGERWGRHWLDVARYADSTGNDEDHRYPHAWRYRDYVIDAFNQDMPYDQFVREQVAGDLMPSPDGAVNRRGIIATGFLALGAKAIAQQDKQKMLYDVYDEQIDVTSKAFLGLTVACARCHDHKFDPIRTRDYYSLLGIFASTRSFQDAQSHVSTLLHIPLVPREEHARYKAHQDKIRANRAEVDDLVEGQKERLNQQLAPRLADYMLAARRVYQDAGDIAATATAGGLSEDTLKKWVNYLKPGKTYRPHLEEWHQADAASLAKSAQQYQTRYQQRLTEWTANLAQWRERARLPGNAPQRPMFEAETDGFFFDVYIQRSGPMALAERDQEKDFTPEAKDRLVKLRAQGAELRKTSPAEPDMASAVEENDPVHQKVFIRGDYNSPGEDAPKTVPVILARYAQPPPAFRGSGRRELAEWLARPENPMTARVMVNRLWQWHFGEGLVRTPDNFGKTGERPTHPELLDYLAQRFIASGWSMKAMHRLMLLSSAYQMSSQPGGAAVAADQENRLLSRFPRRRLSIEEIRDTMLAIDGTLDATMGGTLQKGTGTDGENSQSRMSISPEQQKRRTVYLPLRRANLPSLLNLFDFGDATTAAGKRTQTNVAPQALFMLNSEFLTERTAKLAEDLVKEPEAGRVESAYLRVLNRAPSAQEKDSGLSYVSGFRSRFAAAEKEAWQSLCRVLMGSNDFIYVD